MIRTRSCIARLVALALLLVACLPATAQPPSELPQSVEEMGLEIRNVRTPLPSVTSGGQPTEGELRRAAELGYRTVITLRADGEEVPFDERSLVQSLGMIYVSLPVAGAGDVTSENAKALHDLLAETESPILLHCGSGNRVGALLALRAHEIEGEDAETALQVGLDGGLTSLEPVVREKLGLPPAEPEASDGR